MKFDNALQSFLDHLTIERGLSSNSISAYRRDIAKFSDFLDKEKLDFLVKKHPALGEALESLHLRLP